MFYYLKFYLFTILVIEEIEVCQLVSVGWGEPFALLQAPFAPSKLAKFFDHLSVEVIRKLFKTGLEPAGQFLLEVSLFGSFLIFGCFIACKRHSSIVKNT